MKLKVKAPGSCGELVQGTIEGQPFLITCPVSMYSAVEIFAGSTDGKTKLQAAVKKTLEYLKAHGSFAAAAASELPVGKGMASSSADISACCQAVALMLGKKLSPDEITDIALAIEPTDGIFYPGIVMLDHITGKVRRLLGQPPRIHIAIFDMGGKVDTVAFNKRQDLACLNKHKELEVKRAVELVTQGLKSGDAKLIGQGATLSAFANQTILYKPDLEKVHEIASKHGAVGVSIAHSGTVIGVLFTPDMAHKIAVCTETILLACPKLEYIRAAEVVGGGLWKQEGEDNEWKTCI